MIFDVHYKEPKVFDGYSIAGEILMSNDILERIEDVVKFTYTKSTPRMVACELAILQAKIKSGVMSKVVVTDYWYKGSHVIGMTNHTKKIFVNRNGMQWRDIKTYLRNGSHELGHYPLGFGHGSNWTQDTFKGRMMCRLNGDKEDKELSVPYMFEKLVLQLAIEKGMVKS